MNRCFRHWAAPLFLAGLLLPAACGGGAEQPEDSLDAGNSDSATARDSSADDDASADAGADATLTDDASTEEDASTGDASTEEDASTGDASTEEDASTGDASTGDGSAEEDASTGDASTGDASTEEDASTGDGSTGDGSIGDASMDGSPDGGSEPPLDIEPDPFGFEPQADVGTNVYAFSGPVIINGVDGAVAVSVEGGEYSIDAGPFTDADGTIASGQSIEVRQVTALEASTTMTTSLTVGSATETFETTTRATLSNSPPARVLFAPDEPFNGLLPEAAITNGMQLHVLCAADLNGDGHVDVIAAFDTLGIVWLENDGAPEPSFAVHEVVAPPSSSGDEVALGDLDGDGDLDLVVERASLGVVWLENGGGADPSFTEHPVLAPTPSTGSINTRLTRQFLHLLDIDGDLDLDLQFVEQNSLAGEPRRLYWLENDGAADPSFALVDLYETPSMVRGVAPGDVTGDGRPDFVMQDLDDGMTLLTNDGAADPTFSQRDLFPDAIDYRAAAVGDWDQDGDNDLVVSDYDANRLLFFENDGAPEPAFAATATSAAPQVSRLALVDVDGDGDLDVLTDNFLNVRAAGQLDRLEWYQNTGSFGDRSIVLQTNRRSEDYGWFDVVAADLDGDGVPELLTNRGDDTLDGPFYPPLGWYDLTDVAYEVAEGSSSAEPLADHITDTDDNVLTYSILGGPDAAHFSIDAAAGTLGFEAPPVDAPADFDGDNVYRVWIGANDGYLTTHFLFSISVTGS